MKSRAAALFGSALWLVLAPGTIAVLLPWRLGLWRFDDALTDSSWLRGTGLVLIFVGTTALLECFWRFAWTGFGTPAPVAPPRRLIVTGLYRHVRNPMYFALVSLLLGQALWFGEPRLLLYAAVVWAIFHSFVLAYEEPMLREKFPEDHARYMRAVPRWIPRLTSWRDDASAD